MSRTLAFKTPWNLMVGEREKDVRGKKRAIPVDNYGKTVDKSRFLGKTRPSVPFCRFPALTEIDSKKIRRGGESSVPPAANGLFIQEISTNRVGINPRYFCA